MLKTCLLLSLFVLLNSSDCDPQKQDQRISSIESEIKQLKDKVAELERKQAAAPEHHYELRSEGLRTWRFDPATGDTCIQLTSPADWKRKETKSQSCECTEATQQYLGMHTGTDELNKQAQNFFDWIVKPACGT